MTLFGCQVGGRPIDWVMKSRGVSFRHAVELLKTDFSIIERKAPAPSPAATLTWTTKGDAR